jgi:hypothetical protein
MLTQRMNLRLAEDCLETATVHFMEAVRRGEFFAYPAIYLDRFERATAKLRRDLEMDGLQTAFEFLEPPNPQLPLYTDTI